MVYNPQTTRYSNCGWTNPFGSGLNDINLNYNCPLVRGSNGKLYVGGQFTQSGNVVSSNIAQWNTTTGAWSNPFGLGLTGNVNALAYKNDLLYVGGEFTITGVGGATNIAKWDCSNNIWSALGNGIAYPCYSIVIDNSNNIVASSYDNTNSYIQKWSGSWADIDLSSYQNCEIQTMAFDSSYNLYVGGKFDTIHDVSANNIASFTYATTHRWSSLGDGLTYKVYAGYNMCSCIVYNSTDNCLYTGGMWDYAGTTPVKSMAKWSCSTNSWSIIGPGFLDSPFIITSSISIDNDNNILLSYWVSNNNEHNFKIAKWTGSVWVYYCGCNGYISSILADTNHLIYATGSFTQAGNVPANNIALL